MKLPTVKIARDGGYVTINKSDFDAKRHKLYEEEAESESEPKDDAETGRYTVEAKGGGWFDVIGYKGPINEKSLREADAEALAAERNAELEAEKV